MPLGEQAFRLLAGAAFREIASNDIGRVRPERLFFPVLFRFVFDDGAFAGESAIRTEGIRETPEGSVSRSANRPFRCGPGCRRRLLIGLLQLLN